MIPATQLITGADAARDDFSAMIEPNVSPTSGSPNEGAPMTDDGYVAPTLAEIEARLSQLPQAEADQIRARLGPAPPQPGPEDADLERPPPSYRTWPEFLDTTTQRERMAWCRTKAKKANGPRLMSGEPATKVTFAEVWRILETAQGRCFYCGSLAVEKRPSGPAGQPKPWSSVGRRIGSLSHTNPRFHGGTNEPANLGWACLWCNTWPNERTSGATDHGAIH